MRIGHGYDVHRLVTERPLIIGGVYIPWEKGLLGHSDADVLLHAVMDALLGAAGMGDIGGMFPDSDPEYKDADSSRLLEAVVSRVRLAGFRPRNLDCTIIAQAPKLAPHIENMKINISKILELPLSAVNLKATTEEGLGFTGAGEGISAHAVVLLREGWSRRFIRRHNM